MAKEISKNDMDTPTSDNDEDYTAKYGGCDGPNSVYLKLISKDGHEFIVNRARAVETSDMVKRILQGPFKIGENESNELEFRHIASQTLLTVCLYFSYKAFYNRSLGSPGSPAPDEFIISSANLLDVLLVADFFGC